MNEVIIGKGNLAGRRVYANKEEAERWRDYILKAEGSITPERKTSPHASPVPALA